MSRMSEMCQAHRDYCNENYGPGDIPEPEACDDDASHVHIKSLLGVIEHYRKLYEAESAEVQSLNQKIERLEARIRRAADSSTDPVVARDLREALTTTFQPEVDFASPEEAEEYDRSALGHAGASNV